MNDILKPKLDMNAQKPDVFSDTLSAIANETPETLSSGVKTRQRAALLAHAEQLKPAASPVMPATEPSKVENRKAQYHSPWRGFALGFAGVLAAVALVLVYVSPNGLKTLPGTRQIASVLSIPSAYAADAFLLVADNSDASGVAANSTLTITSKVDVTPEVLKQSLRIDPPIEVDVVKTGTDTYTVTPKQDLAPGETYRVSIETLIDKEDGTRLRREFSWALQAKNDMRVLSTIPRDGSSYVPVTTGIEFKLSRDGWTDVTSSFSIVPNVPGRFEARGRYLTFIPKLPFEAGRRYEVTLKKGFGGDAKDQGLVEDVKIRFETAVPNPTGPNANQQPMFSIGEFQEKSPNTSWLLDLGYTDTRSASVAMKAEIIGYRLDTAEARSLLEGRLQIPTWAPVEAGRFEAYEKSAKTEAFRAEADTVVTNYQRQINIPAAPAGFYAVRVTPKTPTVGKPTWMFLQLTDVAAYVIADDARFFVWSVNPSTNRPLSNLRIRLAGQDKRTDERGLVELQTPSILLATTTQSGDVFPYELTEYGEEGSGVQAFGIVRKTYDGYWFDLGNRDAGASKTWGYLYLDRPLYRTKDELKIFGLAQDRDSGQSGGDVEVRLRKSSYWMDWATGGEKVFQSKTIHPDAAGRFDTSFSWDELAQGYYTIEVRRGTETVATRSFEVREFAKPAYALSVVMDKDELYDGDQIAGTLKASFFEGTPMPKMRAKITWDGGETTVETDESGSARFTVPYRLKACVSPSVDRAADCPATVWLNVNAVPVEGEEGQIMGTATVIVQRSEAGVTLNANADQNNATIDGNVWRRILGKGDTDRSQAWANRPVTLYVFGRRWERVQTGFRYDTIEKKQVPTYRYQEFWDAPVVSQLTTDARGNFTHVFPVDETHDYYVIAQTRDDQNRVSDMRTWTYRGAWNGGTARAMPSDSGVVTAYPRLELSPKPPEGGPYGFGVGEEVTATYLLGEQPLDASKTPGILFLTGSRGLRTATVQSAADFKFRFEQNLVPNAEVRAITWREGHFELVQATAEYRREDKSVVIEATPRKAAYAPGETVEVDVTARLKSGLAPASNTVIAFGAVDKALLAISYDDKAAPLDAIYGYVSDGVIFTSRIHDSSYDGFGGAEKGGGGSGDAARLASQVRVNFKDTAAFGTVMTDNDGKATLRFTAPDNITGWRLELVGISARLEAGAGRADVNVTKPVFVDAVVPPRLLTTDKPFLKLRAYGAGLTTGDAITFSVKAPTLGIDQQVPGRAGEPLFVGISKLVDGLHAITISITSAKGTDSVERTVTVAPSRFLRDEFVRVDAAPGTSLPAIGRPEATIQFIPQNRAALQPLAYDLINSGSSRSDALLTTRLAAKLLREDFRVGTDRWWGDWLPQDAELATRLADYQDEAGGMRLVTYGTADLELSSEIAATVPEYVDRESLAGYLWQALDSKDASREVQIQALSGLASLGEPVLPSLQAAAVIPELDWREQLAIARGLEAAGDRERALGLLNALLTKVERRDDVSWLKVSDKETDVYEATADAAALAARLAHPEADNLMRYVETNWRQDAFPVLAKARYLKAVLPTRANRDIVLAYTLGGGESVLTFKEGAVQTIDLTSEEASKFIVTRVDGPIAMVFIRREAGRPESKPELAISRRYESTKLLKDLKEGDAIRVVLTPEWKVNAQDGCYDVRDHLPGGFQAVVGWGASDAYGVQDGKFSWYPSLVENGEVSFVACKYGAPRNMSITYTARVVTRGTYTAEAPVIQSESFPSVAAVGTDATFEIK